ncbi:TonB-dependent receptor [Ferruginibacter lapsinanis]|uniref:TonB-dependent receptor n=1 Tax=Ferruginibacter lapsinanis TaxID=563172 RepID=UPI001E4FDF27|nr:TonB-dependent receptor [Ferruginibacter lapsinanis]UEG51211.1 TonB-dependent receptor [Ferruginibacter lapsinanis]
MNFAKQLICIAVMLLFVTAAFSQQQITGHVTDASGIPLAGATIIIKSTGKTLTSAPDGSFTLEAKADDVLEVSSLGHSTETIRIKGRSVVTISLQSIAQDLGQVVMVGSRHSGRVKTESPVPIDVINVKEASLTTAKPDLTSMLNYAAPSFNHNRQSGGDGADQIDLATLRGLGPDQTLVLINGKRRHQTAFVAVFGTRGRGNSGTDLNAIPETSIDRVEILRDGSSAQYGSDAIAGVINLILKKDTKGVTVNAGYSGYYDHKYNAYFGRNMKQYIHGDAIDGKAFSFDINGGIALGKAKKGFINLSANFLTQEKTFRQVNDTNMNNKNSLPINVGRRANGDGSVNSAGAMFNMELPIANSKTTFYAFGGYNYKSSDAYAYTRTYHGYNPLSSARPYRFPVDATGRLIYVPAIMQVVSTPGGGLPDTVYNPHIQTHISDGSLAFGFEGVTRSNWDWDLSNSFGGNDFHYFGDKTFNASLGTLGVFKNHFDDGGFYFIQNTSNVDLSKRFQTIAKGLNLSFGAEYRYEQYGIYEGEEASYANYKPDGVVYQSLIGTYDDNGDPDSLQTPASGAQGFPGFQPVDKIKANRSTIGAYVDAELDVTKEWLLGGAIRVENYSDFGFLSTYKIATRYKVAPNFNIRASASTGFRAPSLQQINFSNTFTNVQGGKTFDVKIAPNYSSITRAAGIPELKEETSVNASVGFSWKPAKNLTVTVDGYLVKIKDRVVLSGQFDNTIPALQTILDNLNVAQAQFFANAVNTTNKGVDIVIDYNKKWGNKRFKALFAGNIQDMTIDKINVPAALNGSYESRQAFFSEREQQFVLASAPPVKLGLTLDYGVNKWGIGTHLTYFGKITLFGYGYANTYPPLVDLDDASATVPEQFNYNGKLVSDLYFSYKLCKNADLYFGADNLFNVHPDLGYVKGAKLSAYDGEAGGPWDAVQMGTNGLRFFTKLAFRF